MANGILAFAEVSGGEMKKSAFEVMSEAKRLSATMGVPLMACAAGAGIADKLGCLGSYGAEKVLVVDSALLENYTNDGYTKAVVALVKAADPAVVLLPASATGKDLAPSVAAALGAPLFTDCTGIDVVDGKIQAQRPVYAGKATITVTTDKAPVLLTLRPNVFAAEEIEGAAAAAVEAVDAGLTEADIRVTIREILAAEGRTVDLTEADVVVSGGRGMKAPEHFNLIEDLAAALGGVTGASRAAVDAGWRPHAQQVGQTGKTVSPKLYVACGISGAIQHLAGMSSSKCIVAINKDAEAPIFKVADFGIVGDVFEILPALTEEVRKLG
jgi:electron transfer flavoprotein alpha subunit